MSERAPGERNPTSPSDMVEALLKPAEWGDDCLYIAGRADGTVMCQRGQFVGQADQAQWQAYPNWQCQGFLGRVGVAGSAWSLEARVPLAALQVAAPAGRWTAGFYRTFPSRDGEAELSSTQPPQTEGQYDPSALRPVVWCEDARYQPTIALNVTGMDATPAEEAGGAERLEFGVEVAASQVLTNVTIGAEVHGAGGVLAAKQGLLWEDRVLYRWHPAERASIEVPAGVEEFGLRLVLESDEHTHERWLRLGGWEGAPERGSVYAAQGVAATPCLRGAAHFPSWILLPAREEPAKLFETSQGTVEFWVKPNWQAAWPPGGNRCEYLSVPRGLFHYGVLWPEHPDVTHYDSLSIAHLGPYLSLRLGVASYQHVNWHSDCQLNESGLWRPGDWHHIACVWDANAERDYSLRTYLDGKRIGGLTEALHEDRLGEDKSVRVRNDAPFVAQLGCLNSGRFPADACFDELRISRTARYTDDFTPCIQELTLDPDTTALFHFNGNLTGEGRAVEGTPYQIEATAGVVEYR